jgi:two-component system cell cycle sensor histidine kinase/response regulator CckA
MKDQDKTKGQLVNELGELRRRIAELEAAETEREQVEEALRESEERFRQMAENSRDVFWMRDPKSLDLLYITPAYERLWGQSVEDAHAEPTSWMSNVHPEDRDRIAAAFEKQIRGQPTENEYRIFWPDGSVRWIRDRTTPILDEAGEAYRTLGVVEDITDRKRAEEALRESEENLRQAQRIAHLGSWALDLESNTFVVSEEMLRIYEYEDRYTGAISMEEFAQYIHPDDKARVTAALHDAIAGVAPYDLEFRILRTDGQVRTLSAQGDVIKDEAGRPIKVVGTGLDITERKQAEERLQILSSVVEQSASSIAIVDREGNVEYGNPTFFRLNEFSPDEVIGKSWRSFVSPHSTLREEYPEIQKTVMGRGTMWRGEVTDRAKDGEVIWREAILFPIKNVEGEIIHSAYISTDITDRKRAEEALRESEGRFRSIFDNAAVGVALVDTDGYVLDTNEADCRFLGYSHKELVGMHFTAFTYPEDLNLDRDLFDSLIEGKRDSYMIDKRYVRKDGQIVWGRLNVSLIRDNDGRPQYTVVVVEDITEQMRTQDALKRSEATLKSIFRVAPVGIGLVSDRIFQWTNDTLHRMVGYSADELRGKSARMLYPSDEEYERGGREKHAEIGAQGTGAIETCFQCKDGSVIDILLSSTPLDPTDLSAGVTFTALDITEHKRADEEIRRRAAHQEALGAIVAAAITASNLSELLEIVLDHTLDALGLEMGSIWIPPYAAMRGLSAEIRGAMDHVTSDAGIDLPGPEVVEDWQQVAIDSQLSAIRSNMAHFGIRASLTVPCLVEGRRIGGLSLASPEPRSWSQEEIGLVEAVGQQLGSATERLRLLDRTHKQAQQMEQVMDTVPEGVILLDTDGQVILANPLGEKDLIALANAEVGSILTHLGDHPLAKLLASPPKGLWHEVAADDRNFQIIARPIENGPTPAGWVVVIRDVTQQRQIQQRVQQQERLAAVGQLAAGIAHDFNNIMAAIVLYAQMTMRIEGLPATVRERMETIDQQAKHATKLIQQILDFSRRSVLERRPLDLAPLLKEHVRLLKRTLPESIEIRLDYEPDEYTVNADPTRMQQMVTNLALNARDAMRGGGGLRIRLERIVVKPGESPLPPEMEAGEWVTVAVADTGTGIPLDVLPHIFEPFFTTRAPQGSGLGLAQVHGIVGAHEGHIDVQSQVDQGTTFTIYLPMYSSKPSPVPTQEELPALPRGRGETILVVEDDAVVQKALADGLELLNYRVLEVANGQEALEMLEQRRGEISLVLSDVVMPQMGGIALIHALRERGLTVPVVMLTGHAIHREMEELRAQGMIDWLPKPPRLEELARVIARALGTD